MNKIFSISLAHNLANIMPQSRRVVFRDTYAGGMRGSFPLYRLPREKVGVRIALHTLLYEGTFSDTVDSLVQENFFGASSQPNLI